MEAREQECIRLRRQLKELKGTASLRQLLTHSRNSSDLSADLLFFFFTGFNSCSLFIVNMSLVIFFVPQFLHPLLPLSREPLPPRGSQQQQAVYWSVGREMRANSSGTSSQVRPKPLCHEHHTRPLAAASNLEFQLFSVYMKHVLTRDTLVFTLILVISLNYFKPF